MKTASLTLCHQASPGCPSTSRWRRGRPFRTLLRGKRNLQWFGFPRNQKTNNEGAGLGMGSWAVLKKVTITKRKFTILFNKEGQNGKIWSRAYRNQCFSMTGWPGFYILDQSVNKIFKNIKKCWCTHRTPNCQKEKTRFNEVSISCEEVSNILIPYRQSSLIFFGNIPGIVVTQKTFPWQPWA